MASATDESVQFRSKLQAVTKYQRFVILALLGNIAIVVVSMVIVFQVISLPLAAVTVFRIVALAVTIFMIYSVVMLARQFSNVAGPYFVDWRCSCP